MRNPKIRKISVPLRSSGKIIIAYSAGRINFDLRQARTKWVLAARAAFFRKLGISLNDAVFLEQLHGAGVYSAGPMDRGKGAYAYSQAIKKSDAVVTSAANLALCILTADCLNVFFYHSKTAAVGIAHAGWRGTAKKIAVKTAQKMIRCFGGRMSGLQAYIGPGVGACCYEVSKKFKKFFPGSVTKRGEKIYLDLARENKQQLQAAGIKNVHNIGFCTSCNRKTAFSFRQGDLQKRMLAAIVRIL